MVLRDCVTSYKDSDVDDPFAELDNFGLFSVEDELEEYLKAPPILTVLDPLGWWHIMLSKKEKSTKSQAKVNA
jgi:hypothetical protein